MTLAFLKQGLTTKAVKGQSKRKRILGGIFVFALPLGMALLTFRFLQAAWCILTRKQELLIASHEAEEMNESIGNVADSNGKNACMLFAALSGSSPATVVAIGSIVNAARFSDRHPSRDRPDPPRHHHGRQHGDRDDHAVGRSEPFRNLRNYRHAVVRGRSGRGAIRGRAHSLPRHRHLRANHLDMAADEPQGARDHYEIRKECRCW
jgi:hypothetical protein